MSRWWSLTSRIGFKETKWRYEITISKLLPRPCNQRVVRAISPILLLPSSKFIYYPCHIYHFLMFILRETQKTYKSCLFPKILEKYYQYSENSLEIRKNSLNLQVNLKSPTSRDFHIDLRTLKSNNNFPIRL